MISGGLLHSAFVPPRIDGEATTHLSLASPRVMIPAPKKVEPLRNEDGIADAQNAISPVTGVIHAAPGVVEDDGLVGHALLEGVLCVSNRPQLIRVSNPDW